jgi:two-component system sensor histidine kinase DesK
VSDLPLPPTPGARALARGVTATWWYTAASVLLLQTVTLLTWFSEVLERGAAGGGSVTVVVYLAAAAVSLASSIPLLVRYGREHGLDPTDQDSPLSAGVLGALAAAAAASIGVGVTTGSVLAGAGLAVLAPLLLRWQPRVRLLLLAVFVVALISIWAWDAAAGRFDTVGGGGVVGATFSVMLAPTAVICLWWWDIVVALDRARAAEGRLAATQERLRFASDLHDLQGHHLQVIALQLELAARMLPDDPEAAAEQVRLARTSVDEARAGTRALAARFRGVPLPDEIANAADLLRAAGLQVDTEVAVDAGTAPADILGPVVREATTNVLKHGGGTWASLRLVADASAWRLSVANDRGAHATDGSAGSGLRGITERVGAVGGAAAWDDSADRFEVTVTVPRVREKARP